MIQWHAISGWHVIIGWVNDMRSVDDMWWVNEWHVITHSYYWGNSEATGACIHTLITYHSFTHHRSSTDLMSLTHPMITYHPLITCHSFTQHRSSTDVMSFTHPMITCHPLIACHWIITFTQSSNDHKLSNHPCHSLIQWPHVIHWSQACFHCFGYTRTIQHLHWSLDEWMTWEQWMT